MDHLLFVATRMQIRMHHYPKWGDLVRLETWFQEDGRLATRRDWRLTDVASGVELGAATSTWVTINDATRRLSRLPESVRARFLPLSPSPPRHALPAGETRRKLPDLPEPTASNAPLPLDALAALPEGQLQIARRSEMDPNGHINNVTYLGWALESAPSELAGTGGAAEGWRLAEVEIDFKAECTAGDAVESCVLELPQPSVADAPAALAAAARRARAAAAAASAGRREAAKAGRAAAPGRKRALLKQLLLELAGRGGEAAAVAAAAQQEERRAAAAAAGVAALAAEAADAAGDAAASASSSSSSSSDADDDTPPLPTRQFLHVLRKHEQGADGSTTLNEVWRARLTWVCDGPPANGSSSSSSSHAH
jgi:fatty acyl-ACP thioesterase A